MKSNRLAKPQHITANELEAVARQGLERAMAARQAMNELSEAELAQVSGGAVISKLAFPIVAGGIFGPIRYPNDPLGGKTTVPVLF